MPARPPAASTIEFTLHWDIGADLVAVTKQFFEYVGSAPSASDMNGLCANTQANALAAFQTLCASDVTLATVTGLDLNSSTGASGTHSSSWTGTRSGAILPASGCVVCNHAIARRYRGGKPKNFMPFGVDGDLNTSQQWSNALVTAVGAGYQTYYTDQALNTAGSTTLAGPRNVSYYHGFTVVTSPTTGRARNVPTLRTTPQLDAISSTSASHIVGSQRRRLRS